MKLSILISLSIGLLFLGEEAKATALCAKVFDSPQIETIKPRADYLIVSSPSAGGKTTLIKMLLTEHGNFFAPSISLTTRSPRPGEVNGVDYIFVTRNEFENRIKQNDFIEWAEVHGNLYGSSKSQVEAIVAEGKGVLLNVNVEGAENIKRQFGPKAVTIFIKPPSMEVLEARLRGRGTEDEATIQKRLKNARLEMAQEKNFDIVVVNDKLEKAYADFLSAVSAPKPAPIP
jgi:guanylate kinase